MVTVIYKILGEAEETRISGRWDWGDFGIYMHLLYVYEHSLESNVTTSEVLKGKLCSKVQLHCAGYIFLGCWPLALLF